MSDAINEMEESFNAWWTEKGSKFATMNDQESKKLAAGLAFSEGAQHAADSINKKLKEAIK